MRYDEQNGRVVWSASDLKAAAECEFAWLRAIDAKLGRIAPVDDVEDLTLERASALGTAHELRVLADYRRVHGDGVVEIAATRSSDADGLATAVAHTREALASDAMVVYQAAFSAEDFVGFADFLVRDGDGRWLVQDTKLARQARVTALMQLSAYADQLDALGIPRSDTVELLLGDGSISAHELRDLLPTYRLRRARLRALIADREVAAGAACPPVPWGDPRGELGVVACGRCPTCEQEVIAHRDLLLVAGMRPVQRERLRAAGIRSIDDLAAAAEPPEAMAHDTFDGLRTQARLQCESPAGVTGAAAGPVVPTYEVVYPQVLGALPRPDGGDLFFDFEGDPLYTEGAATQWGIDYLFGWVDVDERYSALWAHTFADERIALESFLDLVALRRRANPGMHIYHYAPYEPTHLVAMAARHGVREAEVDRLLRDGVFVDLYPLVRRALRVGSRSYSIKKLEPLYMGDEVRTSDVQRGDDSIVQYVHARALEAAGERDAGDAVLADIADYNRYDCVSTLRLRDWLVARAKDAGLSPASDPALEEGGYEPSPRAEELRRRASAETGETDAEALRLGGAAIDYYPREAKTFWSAHFTRLREPVSIWAETRDVLVVDPARSRVVEDWNVPEGARASRRLVELRGELAPGSRLRPGARPFVLYERPAPFPLQASPRFLHAPREVTVVEELDDGVLVREFAVDGFTWSEVPLAVTPEAPPNTANQQAAIDAWADGVLASATALPADPATDLLRRRPPRTRAGTLARAGDRIDDIVESVADLDRSYLAVQGPPGTGKTYVGSHVISRLVRERGFRVGVVAQSHDVVEHMLARIVAAGVPAGQVAKAPKDPDAAEVPFTPIRKTGMAAFIQAQTGGFVVGGTAWDMANPGRIARGGLDLLVIDEAGQFSLASTIAVSLVAPRLLLLGDPQQLPQVSQGSHPEPVHTSALGWVMAGDQVLDPEHGYFLAESWRMHPAVAAPVSELAYAGRLASHPSAARRGVEGLEPGVHPVPIAHRGNATASPEEAADVVRIVADLRGRRWDDGDGLRALEEGDVIVVTPYNAQQVLVEQALAAAGHVGVRVGTVDRFQGQEAAVAIVTMAASSGRDAPRGLEFLLLQNRLNVAVSRAKVAAFVLYAPGVLDDLPRTPDGLVRLSAFARLVQA